VNLRRYINAIIVIIIIMAVQPQQKELLSFMHHQVSDDQHPNRIKRSYTCLEKKHSFGFDIRRGCMQVTTQPEKE
jgi:hypothetical protein